MRGVWARARTVVVCLSATVAAAQKPNDPAEFRVGTRLVEVDVAVRGERPLPSGLKNTLAYILDSGPPFGPAGPTIQSLTKDDFVLLDQGHPQSIAVFTPRSARTFEPLPLAPGAVSNRTDGKGRPLESATAVLIDLLNTPLTLTEYARQGMISLLKSAAESDAPVAVYMMGEKLHILQDFGQDPKRLAEMAAELENPHRNKRSADLTAALRDFGDLIRLDGGEEAAGQVHGPMTVRALERIVDHMSGLPGRKSLIWLSEIQRAPPRALAMLQTSNVVLYPVMVRCPLFFGNACGFSESENSPQAIEAGIATGGRGFFDAKDLVYAFQAAREDTDRAYTLGFYPSEQMLDGMFHRVVVQVKKGAAHVAEMHYRSGYLATKTEPGAAMPPPSLGDLFQDQLVSSGIGISAVAAREPQHPEWYDLRVTVDLRDIKMNHADGHFTGSFDMSFPHPAVARTVVTGTVNVDLTDAQFAEARSKGYSMNVVGAEQEMGAIRIAVRDRATGQAGSLSVPVATQIAIK